MSALHTNVNLVSAAYAKAHHMLENQYWDHYAQDGTTPWSFIKQTDYKYVYAGENLAKGFKTSEGVHQAWMASPTHRANILSGKYSNSYSTKLSINFDSGPAGPLSRSSGR